MLDAMAVEPGETVGPYRIDAVLGEGAVGIVYRAVREPAGQAVALKLLKERLSEDETFRRRFVHEARAAQQVEHEHLVPVLDVGGADGRSYLVSAYVAGRTLAQRLEDDGALPLEDALQLVAQVGT